MAFEKIKDMFGSREDIATKRRKSREKGSVVTNRSFAKYEELCGVNLKHLLAGKHVLDIGSGTGDFYEKATELGAEVVSLTPEFKHGRGSDYTKIFHEKGDVGGRAQSMPLADNTFDYEFAIYSIPYWLPKYDPERKDKDNKEFFINEFEKSIDEIIRTLKRGGQAYIYPVELDDRTAAIDILKRKLDKIKVKSDEYEGDRLFVLTKK